MNKPSKYLQSLQSFFIIIFFFSFFPLLGHVGAPLACNIIKLDDVEEMSYFSSNNEGEVSTIACACQEILKHKTL